LSRNKKLNLRWQGAERVRQQKKAVVWFNWFVSFLWLNKTNYMNKTNQIDQVCPRHAGHRGSIVPKWFSRSLLEGGEFRQARQIKNDESLGGAGRLIL
jgi:hypothetical protein